MKKRGRPGRRTIITSVSLDADFDEQIRERINSLYPRVKGFSHYIQMLAQWDLDSTDPKLRRTANIPFERPLTPVGSSAISVFAS